MTRIVNTLTGVVVALVVAIATGAFTLSYNSLQATGQAGGIPPALAWIWPLLIDAPLVVFTLALLVSQLTRQPIRLWAGLVILYSFVTVGFNLAHAQPTPLGWTVATVAPIGLLLTTEALRHLAKGSIERGALVQSLAELSLRLDKLNGQIERAEARYLDIKARTNAEISANVQELNAARAAKIDQRRASVLSMLGQGRSEQDIAGELGVTVKTIRRDITA